MRTILIAAAAAGLLVACREQEAADSVAAQPQANAAANVTADASTAGPLGAPVDAEQAKKLMHERHEAMEKIGKATKSVGRELKSDSPDLDVIRAAAATMAQIAPHVAGLFPPGSGPEVGKTHAKPAVWEKPEDFASKADAFHKAATAFDEAAKSGDLTSIKARFADLGKTCKACHDLYREKDKD